MREKEEVKRKISGPHLCGDALDIKVSYSKSCIFKDNSIVQALEVSRDRITDI